MGGEQSLGWMEWCQDFYWVGLGWCNGGWVGVLRFGERTEYDGWGILKGIKARRRAGVSEKGDYNRWRGPAHLLSGRISRGYSRSWLLVGEKKYLYLAVPGYVRVDKRVVRVGSSSVGMVGLRQWSIRRW